MAPEVEGVDEVARHFFDQGIVYAAGHTAAKYRDGMLAIGLGFRTLTHAFNGMAPLDHRDPSILAAFIQEPRTTVQVICDGFHVAPVMIDILYRTLGERLVLASDYMAPTGGKYRIEGGVVRAEDGTIAGSALQCDQAVRNLMSYASIPFEKAIQSASAAPARMLGIERERGTIARGQQRRPRRSGARSITSSRRSSAAFRCSALRSSRRSASRQRANARRLDDCGHFEALALGVTSRVLFRERALRIRLHPHDQVP